VKLVVECLSEDTLCKADRVGFEAIAHLHSQIDDDHDGSLNRAESAEVLIDSFVLLAPTAAVCQTLCPELYNNEHLKLFLTFL